MSYVYSTIIMSIIDIMLYYNLCIAIHEILNYVISFKEEHFRKIFVQKKSLKFFTLCQITVSNDTLYLIFLRGLCEIIGINNLFILSLTISLVETGIMYNMYKTTPQVDLDLTMLNKFLFHAVIYYQLLQLNIIYAIAIHSYIIYMSSIIRTTYNKIDYYTEPFYKKIMEYLENINESDIYMEKKFA